MREVKIASAAVASFQANVESQGRHSYWIFFSSFCSSSPEFAFFFSFSLPSCSEIPKDDYRARDSGIERYFGNLVHRHLIIGEEKKAFPSCELLELMTCHCVTCLLGCQPRTTAQLVNSSGRVTNAPPRPRQVFHSSHDERDKVRDAPSLGEQTATGTRGSPQQQRLSELAPRVAGKRRCHNLRRANVMDHVRTGPSVFITLDDRTQQIIERFQECVPPQCSGTSFIFAFWNASGENCFCCCC
ncbi:hypothetical protein CEXT_499771 [Caerostris extrusa]|uniref:Uncharacterized protein n=1 Tax=Caerostris extrusa TaxID=172846 RepID=A0AAV4MVH0_CAEEX|nr:hypothetical protein CEXT_499771 [Caerostris extrusa]